MTTICVIGARGGSKGLEGKNIRPLLGKPLIAWTIEQAHACAAIDRVIVSTDDDEIARIAREYRAEVPFIRPSELSGDGVGKWEVWQHALREAERTLGIEVTRYVDLDCTSPLRDPEDIQAALDLFERAECDAVMSICVARKNPYFNLVEYEKGRLVISKVADPPIVRRQDAPQVYEHVASIYVLAPAFLRRGTGLLSGKTVGYDIGVEKSLDVDSAFDFRLIEFLMTQRATTEPRTR